MIKVNESGRSMLEMLGVLSIIGILSVGALYGFHWCMNRYKTNEIINELTMRYETILHHFLKTGTQDASHLNTGEFSMMLLSTYPIDTHLELEGIEFTVQKIPAPVCKMLVENYTQPAQIFVGDTLYAGNQDICDMAELADDMTFVYDTVKKERCPGGTFDTVIKACSFQCSGGTMVGSTCTCPVGQTVSAGVCVDQSCLSNADCHPGAYCFVNAASVGVCKAAYYGGNRSILPEWSTYVSSGMNRISVQNYCDALGKQVVTRQDICGANVNWGARQCVTTRLGQIKNKSGMLGWILMDYADDTRIWRTHTSNGYVDISPDTQVISSYFAVCKP